MCVMPEIRLPERKVPEIRHLGGCSTPELQVQARDCFIQLLSGLFFVLLVTCTHEGSACIKQSNE